MQKSKIPKSCVNIPFGTDPTRAGGPGGVPGGVPGGPGGKLIKTL